LDVLPGETVPLIYRDSDPSKVNIYTFSYYWLTFSHIIVVALVSFMWWGIVSIYVEHLRKKVVS